MFLIIIACVVVQIGGAALSFTFDADIICGWHAYAPIWLCDNNTRPKPLSVVMQKYMFYKNKGLRKIQFKSLQKECSKLWRWHFTLSYQSGEQ